MFAPRPVLKVRYVTNLVEMARPSSLQLLTICPKDVYGRHRRANGGVDLQTATETLGIPVDTKVVWYEFPSAAADSSRARKRLRLH